MSLEFLLVHFRDDEEQRPVLADGESVGFTNHILMLPTGEYKISLSGGGYRPASRHIILAGTSVVKPKVIIFR